MILALVVLLADGLVSVPPSEWKAVAVKIDRNNSTVHCAFDVRTKTTKVQAWLMERSQAYRFNRGRAVNALYSTGFETSARFRVRVQDAGEYVLMLDNRLEGRWPAEVALRIELSNPQDENVRELSPERRRTIVAISLIFFGAVVVFAARQFLKHAT
jgi:hypothetical protein